MNSHLKEHRDIFIWQRNHKTYAHNYFSSCVLFVNFLFRILIATLHCFYINSFFPLVRPCDSAWCLLACITQPLVACNDSEILLVGRHRSSQQKTGFCAFSIQLNSHKNEKKNLFKLILSTEQY